MIQFGKVWLGAGRTENELWGRVERECGCFEKERDGCKMPSAPGAGDETVYAVDRARKCGNFEVCDGAENNGGKVEVDKKCWDRDGVRRRDRDGYVLGAADVTDAD